MSEAGGQYSEEAWQKWKSIPRKQRCVKALDAKFPGSELLQEGVKERMFLAAEQYLEVCVRELSWLNFVEAAVRGSILIKKAGSFKKGAAVFRAVWSMAFEAHLVSVETLDAIKDCLPKDLHQFLRHTVQHGISSQYTGPKGERVECKTLPSLNSYLIEGFATT